METRKYGVSIACSYGECGEFEWGNQYYYNCLGWYDLYKSTDGEAVIVMGNESEIISNILVQITDSEGNVMEYSPFLSGYEGKLVLPESAPTVLDFSNYEKLGYTEEE